MPCTMVVNSDQSDHSKLHVGQQSTGAPDIEYGNCYSSAVTMLGRFS